MKHTKIAWRISIAIFGAILVACGGGGGASVAGIDGTGTPSPTGAAIFGTVTGFGSVIVNGVHFETNSATITIDGEVGSQDDLSVGDVVLVRGTIDDDGLNGSADSVSFDDNVEGPVTEIDRTAGTFVALGQLVRVTADTSFDNSIQPASLDGLEVGDIVEVSGFVDTAGVINATRIETKLAGGEFELTGLVSALNAGTSMFNINSLVVDFSAATLADFPSGSVTDGDLVEVKGTTLGAAEELLATRVEFKGNQITGNLNDHVEIEGLITRFGSATDFDVSGFPIVTNNQTVFEGGTAADLGLNIKVEAEGTLNASGVLVASKVDIRRARVVRVTALVDSAGSDSFVTLGITVTVDLLTRVEDKSAQNLEPFGVGQLAAGEYVEVRGTEFPAGSGQILAGRLEREDADPDTILQGFVTDVTQPNITVLGVTIMTDAGTEFRDENDAPLSATAFFERLAEGNLVKARGTEAADQVIDADRVEFEIEI